MVRLEAIFFLQKNIGVCHIWCMPLSKNQSSLPSCNAVFHWSILDNDGYRHAAVLVAVGLEWVAFCVNCHPVFLDYLEVFAFHELIHLMAGLALSLPRYQYKV